MKGTRQTKNSPKKLKIIKHKEIREKPLRTLRCNIFTRSLIISIVNQKLIKIYLDQQSQRSPSPRTDRGSKWAEPPALTGWVDNVMSSLNLNWTLNLGDIKVHCMAQSVYNSSCFSHQINVSCLHYSPDVTRCSSSDEKKRATVFLFKQSTTVDVCDVSLPEGEI